ncbi:MAG TPA: glutamine--fructose-6-phosphate transaminase (isomerizing) [Candidatus Caccovivens faecavium]|nr:glutamine--fructose-6-phosphate transaminase (isomerizing) [Candidatus Caccovivens faecavium]
MCGICGYIGKNNGIDEVVQGLNILEYRGYDSCGIAYLENKKLKTIKTVGGVNNLSNLSKSMSANIVIGHTRWATHGGVNERNAHPHISSSKKLAMVHNGIIENYKELKEQLDVNFCSETDSEVFLNLIDSEEGSLVEKVIKASKKVQGTFAVIVLAENGEVVLGKRESPLYLSNMNGEIFIASDVLALKGEYFYSLNDDEFVSIKDFKILFYNKNGEIIYKKQEKIEKNEVLPEIFYKTHMESEIYETKNVLLKTLKEYKCEDIFSNIKLPKNFRSISLIACGTAYHASLMGAEYFKEIGYDARAYLASEFRYGRELLNKNTLYIFVSQSGETADTIASAKMVKSHKLYTLALTNTPNSLLNRICKNVLPTFAGREIAVASTKAYTCQIWSLYLFSLYLAGKKLPSEKKFANFPFTTFDETYIKEIASYKKVFFIGRDLDYITAMEASLKLKEISYINCFAIASGELKHGTLALIDEDAVVIAICTQEKIKTKLISNLEEIKARGGKVIVVSQFDDFKDFSCVKLSKFDELFMPIVSVIPMQFLALRICEFFGYNPDKPRNLAKSVTVE